MRSRLTMFAQCRMILCAASWIVPRHVRAEWRKEWEAELVHALQTAQQDVFWRERIGLRRRCCGAFLDAAWYRFNPEDFRHLGERWTRTPAFLLFTLTGSLLLFLAGSGYLPRMRMILMSPPYANPRQMVTVSGSGLVDSSEWMVPYSWVEIWRQQEIFDGIAAYSAQPRQVAITIAGKRAHLASVQLEESLLQVFGAKPVLGAIPHEAEGCDNCFVLSYQAWRQNFSGDPNILAKRAAVDGHEVRIAGVLPQGFWFPSDDVGVWRLESDNSFAQDRAKPVGVVARLRAGMTERRAEWQMRRSIANITGQALGGSLQVWRVQERVRQPLTSYALTLCLTSLLMGVVIWSGRLNLLPQRRGFAAACRWWAFFATKSALLLFMLLAAVVEFAPEPYVFPAGKTTLIVQSGLLWLFSVGCVLVLRWSVTDQQRRCRVCLQKLALPAHIGRSGCLLLAWAGLELVCAEGHGLLHVTETDVCWLDPAQWTQLDQSWKPLFTERLESQVFG